MVVYIFLYTLLSRSRRDRRTSSVIMHYHAVFLYDDCFFGSCAIQVAPPEHPAGTTWVWDDGSGVVLKAEEKAKEEIEQRKAEQKEEVRIVCR